MNHLNLYLKGPQLPVKKTVKDAPTATPVRQTQNKVKTKKSEVGLV